MYTSNKVRKRYIKSANVSSFVVHLPLITALAGLGLGLIHYSNVVPKEEQGIFGRLLMGAGGLWLGDLLGSVIAYGLLYSDDTRP